MDNSHIKWIDILKGIGIIFVVFGHSSISPEAISYIFTFHMPLFFFLSGYLFSLNKYSTFKSFFIKKSKTILIPYFNFTLISILVSLFITEIILHGHINIIQDLIETIISTRNKISYNNPLWFLTSLFCVEIIFYLMKEYVHNKGLLVISVLILSAIGYNTIGDPKLPWTFDSSLYYLVFYGMGNLMNENSAKNSNLNINKQLITFVFVLINISFIYNIFSIKNTSIIYFHNYFYSIGLAVLGFAFYILISQKISINKIANKILSYLGRNSLIIMSLHIVIFNLIYIINGLALRIPQFNLFGIISSIITLCILVPVINFINHYLPFMLGKNMQYNKGIIKETLNESL